MLPAWATFAARRRGEQVRELVRSASEDEPVLRALDLKTAPREPALIARRLVPLRASFAANEHLDPFFQWSELPLKTEAARRGGGANVPDGFRRGPYIEAGARGKGAARSLLFARDPTSRRLFVDPGRREVVPDGRENLKVSGSGSA